MWEFGGVFGIGVARRWKSTSSVYLYCEPYLLIFWAIVDNSQFSVNGKVLVKLLFTYWKLSDSTYYTRLISLEYWLL